MSPLKNLTYLSPNTQFSFIKSLPIVCIFLYAYHCFNLLLLLHFLLLQIPL